MTTEEKARWRELLLEIAKKAKRGEYYTEECSLCIESKALIIKSCRNCILVVLYGNMFNSHATSCEVLMYRNGFYGQYGKPLARFIRNDTLPKLEALK